MKLLLISNSTNAGEEYLQHPKEQIELFLKGIKKVLFLPYAAVTFSFDDYEKKVQKRFSEMGIEVESLHRQRDPKKAIRDAEAIVVGGGNTFKLLKMIQQLDIIETVRFKVLDGTPFVGWSAGANVACPTICTTNDMPIVEPDSFSAFNLVRFQINPHYLDAHPDGHAGETREQRIEEYIAMDPFSYVVGLREGSMILVDDGIINLIGPKSARIFKQGSAPHEYKVGDDFDFLFE
ncbi:MAG: dipeptidase PepE [Bacteroidales bacterium]|jgi:dipeptidase E|nr:dipeptidase PepE [Bacteroidales bacterium]MDD4384882.1 dipeptidase PepE [Bacteroidales bacterium]MDY0197010.1 dipeptidase PepE [Tenuifilaceae bacterium]